MVKVHPANLWVLVAVLTIGIYGADRLGRKDATGFVIVWVSPFVGLAGYAIWRLLRRLRPA